MIDLWGMCEYVEMCHPLSRWDRSCPLFSPREIKRVSDPEKCCANCDNWLVFNESLSEKRNDDPYLGSL